MRKNLFNNGTKATWVDCSIPLNFPDDPEELFLSMIDDSPQCKVEIGFKNNSCISFYYWSSPNDFFKLLNSIKGNKVTLIACYNKVVSFNKKDIVYKIASEVAKEA